MKEKTVYHTEHKTISPSFNNLYGLDSGVHSIFLLVEEILLCT